VEVLVSISVQQAAAVGQLEEAVEGGLALVSVQLVAAVGQLEVAFEGVVLVSLRFSVVVVVVVQLEQEGVVLVSLRFSVVVVVQLVQEAFELQNAVLLFHLKLQCFLFLEIPIERVLEQQPAVFQRQALLLNSAANSMMKSWKPTFLLACDPEV